MITDMEISLKEGLAIKEKLAELLSRNTGQKLAKIKEDMERDFWMNAEQARDYGLVDEILTKVKH
jgi:ATP-dependent Clp protease protease subunit